jgi:hypothetical protein
MIDLSNIFSKEEYYKTEKLSYEQFCDLIHKIVKLSVEESLKALPQLVIHLTNQAAHLKNLSTKFYNDNELFKSNKTLVSQEIEKAEIENPGKPYEDVLKVARKRLDDIFNLNNNPVHNPKDLTFFDKKLGEL